jgi:hypothetical protein
VQEELAADRHALGHHVIDVGPHRIDPVDAPDGAEAAGHPDGGAERHATRPVCAATSGAYPLEHPSATCWRTRLPWGVPRA